jgi:hypothetical protein
VRLLSEVITHLSEQLSVDRVSRNHA